MMPSNVLDVDNYSFTKADSFLVDANIWIYVYGPQGPINRQVRLYSKALKNILAAKSLIFIDVLIMSEFINRYARLEYAKRPQRSLSNYKSYRESLDFKPVAVAIANASRHILKDCKRIQTPFESLDINAILTTYETNCLDFNDQIIAETCTANNLKFITHDSDFANYGLTILTANDRILKT